MVIDLKEAKTVIQLTSRVPSQTVAGASVVEEAKQMLYSRCLCEAPVGSDVHAD